MKKFEVFKKRILQAKKTKSPFLKSGVKELEAILKELDLALQELDELKEQARIDREQIDFLKRQKPRSLTIEVDGESF